MHCITPPRRSQLTFFVAHRSSLLRTANARHGRAHQSDASARIFCVLRRVFWSPQGHLVGDAAIGRACILCAPARSKERGASSQNLRTSAPFVALRGLSQVINLKSFTELIKCFKFDLSLLCPTYADSVECAKTGNNNFLIIFILTPPARTAQSASMTGNRRGSILLSPNWR